MPEEKEEAVPVPGAGPSNLVPKRLNIASQMVMQAVALWTAMQALNELQLEYLQAGTFLDSDFTGTSLTQLSAFLVGDMLTTVTPGLNTAFTTALPNSGPIPRDIILQLKG